MAGADLGFSVGRAPTLQGAPTYDLAKFPKNSMKLKKMWAVGCGDGFDQPLNGQ